MRNAIDDILSTVYNISQTSLNIIFLLSCNVLVSVMNSGVYIHSFNAINMSNRIKW